MQMRFSPLFSGSNGNAILAVGLGSGATSIQTTGTITSTGRVQPDVVTAQAPWLFSSPLL